MLSNRSNMAGCSRTHGCKARDASGNDAHFGVRRGRGFFNSLEVGDKRVCQDR